MEHLPTTAAKTPVTAAAADWLSGARLPGAAARDEAKLAELEALAVQYAAMAREREQQLEMAKQQLSAMQADRELEPIEGAQAQIFRLKHLEADVAAKKILSLFGARTMRVAADARSNSLVVFAKPDQMEQINPLLQALDAQGEEDVADVAPKAAAKSGDMRSVLLRVFWLADGLPEGEGEPPANYLPGPVLEAMDRLGLDGPRLVAQTVNSLASLPAERVSFATNVPALLFKQPAQLSCSGEMDPVTGDRTRLRVQINVTGHVVCDLSGSLVTPLGHYMVLGTANSILGDRPPTGPMGMGPMEGAKAMAGAASLVAAKWEWRWPARKWRRPPNKRSRSTTRRGSPSSCK
jgi:hypothetical protein